MTGNGQQSGREEEERVWEKLDGWTLVCGGRVSGRGHGQIGLARSWNGSALLSFVLLFFCSSRVVFLCSWMARRRQQQQQQLVDRLETSELGDREERENAIVEMEQKKGGEKR